MLVLRNPFKDLMPTQLPHSGARPGDWLLEYNIEDLQGNPVCRSYFQAPSIVELLRQLAQAHADATLALTRSRKREARLKASK
jgi:hypothetical protein